MAKHNPHIVCDLETLDTASSSVILSIGFQAFSLDRGLIGQPVVFFPSVSEQFEAGRTASMSTLSWWMKQGDKAVAEAFRDEDKRDPSCVINAEIVDYFKATRVANGGAIAGFWGNGPSFDNVILSSYLKTFNYAQPWSYKIDRCARTLFHIFDPKYALSPKFEGAKHDAGADARHEALRLLAIAKHIPEILS